jgi:hypothetical protein
LLAVEIRETRADPHPFHHGACSRRGYG